MDENKKIIGAFAAFLIILFGVGVGISIINTPKVASGDGDAINPKMTISDTIKFQHTDPDSLDTIEIYSENGGITEINEKNNGVYIGKLGSQPSGNYTVVSIYKEGNIDSTTIQY